MLLAIDSVLTRFSRRSAQEGWGSGLTLPEQIAKREDLRARFERDARTVASLNHPHIIGTIRRECLDFVIPINEWHLRRVLREWVHHYNRGRPHSALGPGIPEPLQANIPACSNAISLRMAIA